MKFEIVHCKFDYKSTFIMKTIKLLSVAFTLSAFVIYPFSSGAQGILDRAAERAKQKVNQRIENKIDQQTDKALDKAEEAMTPKEREEKRKKERQDREVSEEESGSNEVPNVSTQSTQSGRQSESMSAYSKFDFIPGEKVIYYDDFMQEAIGDFPVNWNTNGSGEVVSLSGKPGRWLKFSGDGDFYPENIKVLPENFTLEFDLATLADRQLMTQIRFVDNKLNPNLLSVNSPNWIDLLFEATGKVAIYTKDANDQPIITNDKSQDKWIDPSKLSVKISIWRQKNRLRVYMDETKVFDLPKAFASNVDYRLVFHTFAWYIQDKVSFISNFRLASGAPDTRSKLITEGKFSTTGIKFDTGSDKIKPESFSVLKEIAEVLKENSTVNIKIVGHTDSDGDDKANQILSEKRALSVKNSLSNEFGIASSRMQTEGKGEYQPTDNNTSPSGKANNRRVEFIKM